jgi:hypothetical protein
VIAVSFWEILLACVAFLAWVLIVGVAMFAWFWASDEGGIAYLGALMLTIIAVGATAAGIWLIVQSEESEADACRERGGEMVKTGTRTLWTGKVFIRQPVYECAILVSEESP